MILILSTAFVFAIYRVMLYISNRFIHNKHYFFYQNQSFTCTWFIKAVTGILWRRPNSRDLLVLSGLLLVQNFLQLKYNLGTLNIACELLILVLIISACYMDIKTMCIDAWLSYTIATLLLLQQFIFYETSRENFISIGIVGIIAITVFIMSKILKRAVIGGADTDFVLGMILYFKYQYASIFLISAGIFGIFTKLALNAITKETKTQAFPFLPGICLAFYFTRLIQNLDFAILNKLF